MIIYNELTNVPAFTMAITTARIHQAVISSAAAQVITIALILFYECRVPAQFLPKLEKQSQSNPQNKLKTELNSSGAN
jgi:hypothetical protein